MDLGLRDQVVFVAGSTRGIGRAIATRLVEEGARVVVTGRDESDLRTACRELDTIDFEKRVLGVACDLARPSDIDRALSTTLSRFGRLDHVVANVGSGSGPLGWDVDDDAWLRLLEVNLLAATRLTRAALPHLLARPGGSLLYIASIVAVEATDAPFPYSAAKAALVNYAKNLSRRVAASGLRVNSIAPGNVIFAGGSWERHRESDPAAVAAMLEREVPLGRFGMPDEIASLAAWLCSPLAGFATGGCYTLDGGQTRVVHA